VAQIQALKDTATDKEIVTAFRTWFLPEKLARLTPLPDLSWYLGVVKRVG
jgi:hypothetical protein